METMETVLDAPCRTTRWAPEKLSVASLPLRTVLLSRLQRIDAGQVGDDEVIERIISCQKMINMLQAQLISEQAEFARRRLEGPFCPSQPLVCQVHESAHQEIGAALRLTRRTAKDRFDTAVVLVDEFPSIVDALHAGRIDYARAEILLRGTAHLNHAEATAVIREALTTAEDQTTGEVRARVARLTAAMSPEATEKKAKKKARQDRDVKAWDRGDGNAELAAVAASGDIAEAMAIINSAAWHAKKADRAAGRDVRSIGEARADSFIDLIRGPLMKYFTAPDNDEDTKDGEGENTEGESTEGHGTEDESTETASAESSPAAGNEHRCSCGADHTTQPPAPLQPPTARQARRWG